MKQKEDQYIDDGYYYPPAPVGETIFIVGLISILMMIVLPLSLYYVQFISI